MKYPSRKFALLTLAVIVATSLASDLTSPATHAATVANEEQVKLRVQENFGKLPRYFIENRGQMDGRVADYVQGQDKTVYFTAQGITYALSGKAAQSAAPPAPQSSPAVKRTAATPYAVTPLRFRGQQLASAKETKV